jgi:hypothetical protein
MAYRVYVVSMGTRSVHHASAFAANPRFELAAICSRDPRRLAAANWREEDVALHRGASAAGGNSAAKSRSVRLRQLAHPSPSLASPPAGW